MSSPPVVVIIGSTGTVGKCLMPAFLEALGKKQLKELRVLATQGKENSEPIKSYVTSGAKATPVPNYENSSALAEALKGADVVVSTLGTKGADMEKVKGALLDALVTAKVKVYFPSEFGTNHYKVSYNHPVFEGKRSHYNAAKKKGIRTIRMLNGNIMETSFGKWFGLDCKTGVWTVVGNGADIPCAMTSEKDLARFTLEAVLLAHKDPKCPDELEVLSDMRTLREYAKAFDKITGGTIKINTVPIDTFKKEYENGKEFTKLIMLMFAEGAYNYSKSTGNNLLNPNESGWKLKKIEDYAKETNGVPWKDFE